MAKKEVDTEGRVPNPGRGLGKVVYRTKKGTTVNLGAALMGVFLIGVLIFGVIPSL